jgi:hypothetical protein
VTGPTPLFEPECCALFGGPDLATPVGVCSATAGKKKMEVGLGIAEAFYNSAGLVPSDHSGGETK